MAKAMSDRFDAILIGTLSGGTIHAVHEPCAGVVLAAGGSSRFGAPKQLLRWRGEPLVRIAACSALRAGLSPVIVVTGASSSAVEACLADLRVLIARNENWQEGQASSLRVGLASVPPASGSAVFLLADQPHVTSEVIRALVQRHALALPRIVAPLVQGNRRGNPVLFDRTTFADLAALSGDVGGRAIFPKHSVEYLPWHDELLLADIDRPDDFRRLGNGRAQ